MERYSINRSDKKWLVMKQSTILKKEITFSSKHHKCDFIYSYHFKLLFRVRRYYIVILFLLLTTGTHAQKVIPLNADIECELCEYLIDSEILSKDLFGALNDIRQTSWPDSVEVFAAPVLLKDMHGNVVNNLMEYPDEYGIFMFYCPHVMPLKLFILLKYQNEITIVDYQESDHDFVKQADLLVEYFNLHKDIPRSDFINYMKYMIAAYEYNISVQE